MRGGLETQDHTCFTKIYCSHFLSSTLDSCPYLADRTSITSFCFKLIMLCIQAFGAFDKDTSSETALTYPSMYQEGVKGIFFSRRTCLWWIMESVLQSLICYVVCTIMYAVPQLENGMGVNIWHMGSLIHFMIVLTANMRIVIMTRDFTWTVILTHILCTGGWLLLFWMFCAEFWGVPTMYE